MSYRPPALQDISWWQTAVQPTAEELFPEACKGWNWPLMAGLCVNAPTRPGARYQAPFYRLASLFTRAARFTWSIVGLYCDLRPERPVALAVYLADTKGLRPSDPRTLYLEWFMAQPSQLHGLSPHLKFGQYLMDWLILQSHQAGHDGRISLHAASDRLCPVYEGWGFSRISPSDRLIPNRRNNGLFYELLPSAALAFNNRFDHLR